MDFTKFKKPTNTGEELTTRVVVHVPEVKRFKVIKEKDPEVEYHAPKFKVSDFKVPIITEELRLKIYKYYKDKNNSIYDQKHRESIGIAETILEQQGLVELANHCNRIKPTMSVKGWQILLTTEFHAIKIQIVCLFKANYIRHFNITVIKGDDFEVVYNGDVKCEKTVI